MQISEMILWTTRQKNAGIWFIFQDFLTIPGNQSAGKIRWRFIQWFSLHSDKSKMLRIPHGGCFYDLFSRHYINLTDKHLCPIVTVCYISHTYLRKRRIQNVCSVPAWIHPAIDYRLRRFISHGNIFAGSPVSQSEILYHSKGRTVSWTGMRKVLVVAHILRFVSGNPAQLPIQSKFV